MGIANNVRVEAPKAIFRFILCVIVFWICCCFPDPGEALTIGNAEFNPALTLQGEFNDNVTLSSGIGSEIIDDFLTYLTTALSCSLPWKKHEFLAQAQGDYRFGKDSELSELNFSLTGKADLNFARGLSVLLEDSYRHEEFDLALYHQPGIRKNTMNDAHMAATYSFVNRFSIGASFRNLWQYLETDTLSATLTTDTFAANINVPLSLHIATFCLYNYRNQDSDDPELANRINTANSLQLGLNWSGPNRFEVWVQGGKSEIDFEVETEEDYEETVGELGLEVRFSELTNGRFFLGQNGYGNLFYGTQLSYKPRLYRILQFKLAKETYEAISPSQTKNVIEILRSDLHFGSRLISTLYLRLNVGYQLQDYVTPTNDEIENQIILAGVSLDYSLQRWLKLGVYYKYAERTSDYETEEFENNRFGLYLTATL